MKKEKKEFRLPKEFGKKWLEALRSGEYKQGKQELLTIRKNEKTYCCLGVACKIVGHGKILEKTYGSTYLGLPSHLKNLYTKKCSFTKLPKELKNKDGEGLAIKVANMNDDGKKFKTIANWVEKNVEFY